MGSQLLKKFSHQHHNRAMRKVTRPIDELAELLDERVPDGTIKNDGLRYLIKARECFTRALVADEAAGARTPGSIRRSRDQRRQRGQQPPHL
jgi:hypothetical protein